MLLLKKVLICWAILCNSRISGWYFNIKLRKVSTSRTGSLHVSSSNALFNAVLEYGITCMDIWKHLLILWSHLWCLNFFSNLCLLASVKVLYTKPSSYKEYGGIIKIIAPFSYNIHFRHPNLLLPYLMSTKYNYRVYFILHIQCMWKLWTDLNNNK